MEAGLSHLLNLQTERIISEAVSFMEARGLNVAGLAVAGSRVKRSHHKGSDFDLIVLSLTPRNLHIEDFRMVGERVQLFLFPLHIVDRLLLFNVFTGNGNLASMFEALEVHSGADLFDQIRCNLAANRQTHRMIERETANRDLIRLRYRASKLLKDLSNSTSSYEKLFTATELLRVAGHLLLAKKELSYRPTEKHLHKELVRACSEREAQMLADTYIRAVAETTYANFIDYCTEVVLDGSVLSYGSTGQSSYGLKKDLGYNVILIKSYSPRLVRLIYECMKQSRPLLILNEHRDLLHLGVYFIVDISDMSALTEAIGVAQLRQDELGCITINYQLDKLLLNHLTQYDHHGLMTDLSAYTMECDLNRDVMMNSVLDWILNVGIATFNRDEFMRYVEICLALYHGAMTQEPDKLNLDLLPVQTQQVNERLERMNSSSVTAKYRDAVKEWVCMDVTDVSWRHRILEASRQPLPLAIHQAVFKNEPRFRDFHALFEAVFNATLLPYRDRGLVYWVLHRCLIDDERGSYKGQE